MFLNKLTEELLTRFLIQPTINAVKSDILKLNALIFNDPAPAFSFRSMDRSGLEKALLKPHRHVVRMVLLVFAYYHQDELLPDNWQIEHILPRKWQDSFFVDVPEEEIDELVEHIGNKTPFERKLNMVASNGYFAKKQAVYSESSIEVTRALTLSIDSDWTLGNIKKRDELVTKEVLALFKEWDVTYKDSQLPTGESGPSEEELAQIKKFKAKGWV